MAHYEVVWAQHASDQFYDLPPAAQRVVMDAIADIQADPVGRGIYEKETDRYTADFSGDAAAGLIVYIVAQGELRVVILRVTAIL